MVQTKAKRKVKAVKKAANASLKSKTRRIAKTAAPRRRRKAKASFAKEFGALAEQITSFGKAVLEQGTERAGEVARAGLSAIGHGGEKLANEIAAIKRAALMRSRH